MNHSFNVQIAINYGVEESIIIQNLSFWIAKNIANDKHFYDGNFWTYNSVKAFEVLFPYWKKGQISRILKSLVDKGVITKGNYNENKYDQTAWYSVREDVLSISLNQNFHLPKTRIGNTENENCIKEQIINTDNNYYIINENLKIFQKNENERYNYASENFVIFKESLGTTKKIIVPEIFISDYFQKNDRVKFEGFLRNDFGSFPPAERIKEFEKLAKKAMAKFNAEILENFQHFINICRKIKDEPVKSNFQPKNISKENGYKAGVTNHGEGWN